MVRTWIETPNNAGTGPSEEWYADDTNSYNWRTIDVHRDDHRQTTGFDVAYDDGSKDVYDLDYNNTAFWSSKYAHYDTAGENTYSKQFNHDGSSSMSFWDPYNQTPYNYENLQYDTAGRLSEIWNYNHDGSFDHGQYNLSNPVADWTYMTTHIDSAHHVTDDWTTYRGGEQTHTVYDYDNTHSWRSVDYDFDSNGNLQKSVTLYDDGHEWTRF